ncbi:hypothetical protein RHGRI_007200 [Rhododendron griersonianum]|uniref:Uncharacterized protein n=1 Tax=Rhododendron griersonianum TaxID=479676 RepID=A0AAV6KW52_9ERIC|nr:hypothetical protein RHGRI_007200 [Rhododendron griersonianum]
MNSEGMIGQPSATVLATKMYEERMVPMQWIQRILQVLWMPIGWPFLSKQRIIKGESVSPRQLWERVCGFVANAGMTSNDHCNYSDHTLVHLQDIKQEVNMGASQKSMPMDPSSVYRQAILQSKSGLGGAGYILIQQIMYEQFDAESVDVDDARLEYFAKKVFSKIKDFVQSCLCGAVARNIPCKLVISRLFGGFSGEVLEIHEEDRPHEVEGDDRGGGLTAPPQPSL